MKKAKPHKKSYAEKNWELNFIYTPREVIREKVNLIFPCFGKEWKVKEIPYRGK